MTEILGDRDLALPAGRLHSVVSHISGKEQPSTSMEVTLARGAFPPWRTVLGTFVQSRIQPRFISA